MILTLAVTVVVAAVAGLSLVLWLVPYPEDGEPMEHAGTMGPGTLYGTLKRLDRDGLVEERDGPPGSAPLAIPRPAPRHEPLS